MVRAIPEYNHELFCPHSRRGGPSAISALLCISTLEGAWAPTQGPAKLRSDSVCAIPPEPPVAWNCRRKKASTAHRWKGNPEKWKRRNEIKRSHNPHAAVASAHGNTQVHGSRTLTRWFSPECQASLLLGGDWLFRPGMVGLAALRAASQPPAGLTAPRGHAPRPGGPALL